MPDDTSPTLTVTVDADIGPLQQQLADAAKLGTKFSNTLGNALVDVAVRGKSLGDVLRSLTLSLSALALKAAFKPLTDSIGSGLAGLFGGGVAFAKGGVVPGPMPVPFAAGGVISSPISFPLAGNQLGVAGERGAEAILPLTRGPDGSLGVQANAGGGMNITFNVSTPDAASFQRSETQLAALLARAVAQGQRNL